MNRQKENRFGLTGYEDMELSTQIIMKEALAAGVAVKVVDRAENIIRLEKDGHVEYVKQATITRLDNYVTPALMENKSVSKMILAEAGIPVPQGIELAAEVDVDAATAPWVGRRLVVKPKSTNYGVGISVLDQPATADAIKAAVALAFTFDEHILLEEYIPGKEYRFLVIGGKTVAVLHRRAANVVGDGQSSLRALVDKKNTDPRRGVGHEKPLNQILFDTATLAFLKEQNLTPEYVPEKDVRVYLRGNSNISTGGDSLDYTEIMPQTYKVLAEKAAAAFSAFICGVDLIIEDLAAPDSAFAIIEANYNPHLAMQCYPYEGEERPLGKIVLEHLMGDAL